ncbi:hypothetical protein PVAND_013976 [Polypedilum vanderplanki]|uniref:Uncharacterized protein n=1 Tax=Polypedilum vanderplanki TaxID=319348 RepID=A0A9J6CT43_POLVA|nr:hypothetical protein PVAND_013976 [Polypedilum vanderplanki]
MAPKTTKASKKEAVSANTGTTDDSPISILKSGDIAIKILAKPGSKENGITGINEEGVIFKISAPPIDGEANTELISYLSKLLGLRKSDLTLDRGSKSRTKTVTISKDCKLSLENIRDIIKSNVGK